MNLHSTSGKELEMSLPHLSQFIYTAMLVVIKELSSLSQQAQECLWALQHSVVRKRGEKSERKWTGSV